MSIPGVPSVRGTTMTLQPVIKPAALAFAADRQLAPCLGMAYPRREGSVGSCVSKRVRVALWALCVIVTLSPLLWVRIPPLVDYPNHLARMWILVHRTEIHELAANYAIHWRILPELGMDLVVSALAWVLPVAEAGRVFVALTMLVLVAGTMSLHRVLYGRLSAWPICSVLFVYNAALFWGFLNCLFATGIYLFAFSGWIATRHWRWGRRLLTFSAVASLLLMLHLFSFGLYGLSVASYELGSRIAGPRLTRSGLAECSIVCLQFVPGAWLWYI